MVAGSIEARLASLKRILGAREKSLGLARANLEACRDQITAGLIGRRIDSLKAEIETLGQKIADLGGTHE